MLVTVLALLLVAFAVRLAHLARVVQRQGVQIQTLRELVEGQAEDIQALFAGLSKVRH